MKMGAFTQLCVFLVIVSVIQVSEQQDFMSPCPEVFSYETERSTWVGRIELPSANIDNDLNLEVVLSLKRPLPSDYKGFVALKDDLATVFQNIIFGRKITYIVNFPLKVEIPSIVSITFNGKNYCDGVKPKKYATIIPLKHKSQLKKTEDAQTTTKKSTSMRTRPGNKRPISRKPSTQGSITRPGKRETTMRSVMLKPSRFSLTPATEPAKDPEYYDYENIFNIKDDSNKHKQSNQFKPNQNNPPDNSDDSQEGIIKIDKDLHKNQENNMRPKQERPTFVPDHSKDETSDSPDYSDYFVVVNSKIQDDKQNTKGSSEPKEPDNDYSEYFTILTSEKPPSKPGRPSARLQAEYVETFIKKFEENTKRPVQREPSADVEYYDDEEPVKQNGPKQSEEAYPEEDNSETKGVIKNSEEAYDS